MTDHDATPWISRLRRQTPMKLGWMYVHRIDFRRGLNEVSDRQKRLLLAAGFPPKLLQPGQAP